MTIPAASTLPVFRTVSEVVEYFRNITVVGTQARLTATLNASQQRIRNYFYRQECKVSIENEADGTRVITLNGYNETGRQVVRKRLAKYNESGRQPDELTPSQVIEENGFEVGATLFVKGNRSSMAQLLRKRYGAGAVAIRKNGAGHEVTRLR